MTHRFSPFLPRPRYGVKIPNTVGPSDDRSFFVPEWNHGSDPRSLMEHRKKTPFFSIAWEPGQIEVNFNIG